MNTFLFEHLIALTDYRPKTLYEFGNYSLQMDLIFFRTFAIK